MKLALLTTDNRQQYRDYANPRPWFGAAPEALLQGFAGLPGLEVHIISCLRQPVQSPAKLAENVWYHSLHVPQLGWMRTLYQGCVRATRRKLRALQPDIVHGQGTELDCAISAVFGGFPNVVTIHGNMAELARLFKAPIGSFGWLAARLENFTLPRTAGVFCNSAYTESLIRPRARRVWRVPNALREAFFVPRPVAHGSWDRFPTCSTGIARGVLLNVGVVSPRKRQVELLEWARGLRQRGVDFELRFIGEAKAAGNPYADVFLKRIQEVESEGWAKYLGPLSVDDLVRAFDGASGLIHFPSEEAFGLVVAEALARSMKFFGAAVGGIVDIASGVDGAELIGVEDWDGLAAVVERWLRAGCPQPTRAAEAMAARYHPRVVAQRHVEIYREVLAAAAR